MIKCIYISGPMEGIDGFNVDAFDAAEVFVRSTFGCDVYNPATMSKQMPDKPRSFYMRCDIEALLNCEAIVQLPNWHLSKGAMLERDIAFELGLGIWELEHLSSVKALQVNPELMANESDSMPS